MRDKKWRRAARDMGDRACQPHELAFLPHRAAEELHHRAVRVVAHRAARPEEVRRGARHGNRLHPAGVSGRARASFQSWYVASEAGERREMATSRSSPDSDMRGIDVVGCGVGAEPADGCLDIMELNGEGSLAA